jgi:hypothetical protein
VLDILREALLQPGHLGTHRSRHLDGAGGRVLHDLDAHRRLAVEQAAQRVRAGAEFDARHVLQPQLLAARPAPENDLAEGLGRSQPPGHGQRQLVRAAGVRLLAHRARGHLQVLRADRVDHVAGDQAARGHAVGVEPDAQAVVAGAPDHHLADTRHAQQRVAHLQLREVRQVQQVVAAPG